ncbi:GTPase obg [Tetrabaena socialis]|uniref:GTPase obg n=1 Tax=Tetrabaena socialis TaxID=47790 RepID=A0A2J7ZWD0_9CHLO|nr:GTPase obg [Tetrabaena socialis]|eukprot:PNH04577.1 GTPase obg [Tetrabaena socialis]
MRAFGHRRHGSCGCRRAAAASEQVAASRWRPLPSPLATPARSVAAAGASGSRTQPAPAAPSASDWSTRLLSVANKKASNAAPPIGDIFRPAKGTGSPPQGAGGGKASGKGGEGAEDEYYDEDLEGDLEGGPERKRIPAEMRCFDTARILIKGGDGGNGCVAFRREKFVEHGGPFGGCGGRGGNVWAVVDPNLNSLSSFRGQVHFRAEAGVNGEGSNCDGADAGETLVAVPPGTIIRRKEAEPDEPPLAELLRPGERALLATGGRGGRGNFSFKTSRDTAPTIAERGEKGEEMWVDLELKVVADVGIIGVPNAGKSTLLSVVTAARPKIANYPFTTLVPNLGVCEMDYTSTVFADVPGLLEGAHEGHGLGHEFLRHVQRCRVLVHVVDGTSPDPVGDYNAINLELELFNPALRDKPQVRGVRALLEEMGPAEVLYETKALNQTKLPARKETRIDDFKIYIEEGSGLDAPRVFYVEGEGIEKFAQMTNWDYYEAVRRFQRVLDVSGINGALRAKGIKKGDSVVLGETEFAWSEERSDAAVYNSWVQDMKDRGVNRQGIARWPHPDVRQ